jgi:hypothetical protein
MNESSEWPLYHIGSRDHLHAIGVVIASWNIVETAYQTFIQLIFANNVTAGIHAFELLGNDERVKLIRAQLPSIATEHEIDLLDHFIKSTNICKEYRNVLAHAGYANQPADELILMTKGLSKDRQSTNLIRFSVGGIREMADATYATAGFGLNLWTAMNLRLSNEAWISRGTPPRFLPSLPEKPPLPRNWVQIREAPKPDPPPPESSRA